MLRRILLQWDSDIFPQSHNKLGNDMIMSSKVVCIFRMRWCPLLAYALNAICWYPYLCLNNEKTIYRNPCIAFLRYSHIKSQWKFASVTVEAQLLHTTGGVTNRAKYINSQVGVWKIYWNTLTWWADHGTVHLHINSQVFPKLHSFYKVWLWMHLSSRNGEWDSQMWLPSI